MLSEVISRVHGLLPKRQKHALKAGTELNRLIFISLFGCGVKSGLNDQEVWALAVVNDSR